MIKLFTHENRMIVFNLKNVLQSEGIETVVVNEFAGGGAGDLPTFDTWPELWLEDEQQFDRAQTIVDSILKNPAGEVWFCRSCLEANDAAFEVCWKCGRAGE